MTDLKLRKRLQQGAALRAVWLCVVALTVLTVLTAPLAVSKYTAQGHGTAKARVAAWDVTFAERPRIQDKGVALQKPSSFTVPNWPYNEAGWQELPIENASEVMAKVYLFVIYRWDKDDAFPATPQAAYAERLANNLTLTPGQGIAFNSYSGGEGSTDDIKNVAPVNEGNQIWSVTIPPAKTMWVEMTFGGGAFDTLFGTTYGNNTCKAKLYLYAVQVD